MVFSSSDSGFETSFTITRHNTDKLDLHRITCPQDKYVQDWISYYIKCKINENPSIDLSTIGEIEVDIIISRGSISREWSLFERFPFLLTRVEGRFVPLVIIAKHDGREGY